MEQIQYVYLSYGIALGLIFLFTYVLTRQDRHVRKRLHLYEIKTQVSSSTINDNNLEKEREVL